MKLPIFQVDAFIDNDLKGNPAAVVPLKEWLPDELMQHIALENNLSETAFFVPTKAGFELRWFTPLVEVDLCGHATLATSHVIFNEANYPKEQIQFGSKSGLLTVRKSGEMIQLNFPKDDIQQIGEPAELTNALGKKPIACLQGISNYLFIYSSIDEIQQMSPNFSVLAQAGARGIIVSAPGTDSDFVSRFFAPGVGINEDPVTGSAHTTLSAYWSKKLNKKTLSALQISARGGKLSCKVEDDRVLIAGKAQTYLRGEIFV